MPAGMSAQQENVASSSNISQPERSQSFFVKKDEVLVEDSDDDGLLRGERLDVVASVATTQFGRQWSRWIEVGPTGPGGDAPRNPQLYPARVEQFLFLDQLMRERRSDELAQFMGSFRLNAQRTRKENRIEAQAFACAGWKKPLWASLHVFNRQTHQVERTTVAGACSEAAEKQQANADRLQSELEAIGAYDQWHPSPSDGFTDEPKTQRPPSHVAGLFPRVLWPSKGLTAWAFPRKPFHSGAGESPAHFPSSRLLDIADVKGGSDEPKRLHGLVSFADVPHAGDKQ
jgi:hypothetical protein